MTGLPAASPAVDPVVGLAEHAGLADVRDPEADRTGREQPRHRRAGLRADLRLWVRTQ